MEATGHCGCPLGIWGLQRYYGIRGALWQWGCVVGICHSPKFIHLILQGLCLLGQAGQLLVPLLQLSDLPLQLGTAHALVLPAALQPGGWGKHHMKGLCLPQSPGLLAPSPTDHT